jgi:hypothetical protein
VIVPQVEVAGVHLLMSEPGVRRALGRPRSIKTIDDGRSDPPAPVRRMDYGRTKVYLSATADGTVFSVTTTDRRQKTSGGVGVGSARATVARKVRGARCTARVCVVGTERAGKRVTAFALRDGRVARVTLGFVID